MTARVAPDRPLRRADRAAWARASRPRSRRSSGWARRRISSDAVVHELYEGDELRDAVVARWGAEVAPGGVVDRAAVAQRAFAEPEDERAWLEGLLWPLVGARVARVAARRAPSRASRPRARRSSRCRCCSRRGSTSVYDATIAVRRRRAGARASAPPTRGHARWTSAPRASSRRRRRRAGRRSWCATTAREQDLERSCRRCLTS